MMHSTYPESITSVLAALPKDKQSEDIVTTPLSDIAADIRKKRD